MHRQNVSLSVEHQTKALNRERFTFSRVRIDPIPVFDPGEVLRVLHCKALVRVLTVSATPEAGRRGYWVYDVQGLGETTEA